MGNESTEMISVIAPVFNERLNIEEFVTRVVNTFSEKLSGTKYELIIVDDGSNDGSLEFAQELSKKYNSLVVIELRKNFGQTTALQVGIDNACGDLIVTLDADLQHFPEEIPTLVQKINEGWDLVCGWRYDRQEPLIRSFPSSVANRMIRAVSGLCIHDIGTTFRAYRREILNGVRFIGENHRFIPVYLAESGARITEVKITNVERRAGKSSYGLARTISVFFDIVFIFFFLNFKERPMRIFGIVSLLFFLTGSTIAVALLMISINEGGGVVRNHSGWFLLGMMMFISSLQILLAGVITEMMARFHYSNPDKITNRIRTVSRQVEPGKAKPR